MIVPREARRYLYALAMRPEACVVALMPDDADVKGVYYVRPTFAGVPPAEHGRTLRSLGRTFHRFLAEGLLEEVRLPYEMYHGGGPRWNGLKTYKRFFRLSERGFAEAAKFVPDPEEVVA